jgi:hypothetical protein
MKQKIMLVLTMLMIFTMLSSCVPIDVQFEKDMTTSFEPDTEVPDDLEEKPLTILCIAGTPNCYKIEGTTITFTPVQAETVYAISGTFEGNIVIDTGDNYKFDLEMHGFTLLCDYTSPITVLSGDEVIIKAKKDYTNYIYDGRETIDVNDATQNDAAIYSEVDLEIAGKGNLAVVSKNNNGIHTKDDLQIKNLTLNVNCKDNALKGNDGVEITDAVTKLIASEGDCIKTTNSHINANTGNQKGTVYISGGNHTFYAAGDGIDSSYDVIIENSLQYNTKISIFTGKYSSYTKESSSSSSNGIKATNEIVIKSGSVDIQSYNEGIYTKTDGGMLENGNAPKGNVTILGSSVSIKSSNKGIKADGNLSVADGTLTLNEFCE